MLVTLLLLGCTPFAQDGTPGPSDREGANGLASLLADSASDTGWWTDDGSTTTGGQTPGDDTGTGTDGETDDGTRGDDDDDDGGTDTDDGDTDTHGGETDTGWLPGMEEDLCRTRGFWLNHPALWPVATVTLGNEAFDAVSGAALLSMTSDGDASLILADQLLATKLNLAVGAAPGAIGVTVADADAWLIANEDADGLPYGVDTSTVAGQEGVALAAVLDGFNNQTCW